MSPFPLARSMPLRTSCPLLHEDGPRAPFFSLATDFRLLSSLIFFSISCPGVFSFSHTTLTLTSPSSLHSVTMGGPPIDSGPPIDNLLVHDQFFVKSLHFFSDFFFLSCA